MFGYRFQFPPARVGTHEVYWHRPLAAYRSRKTGKPAVLPGAPLGYLTAYKAGKPDLTRPVELWPRLLRRELHLAAIELFRHSTDGHPHQTVLNVRKLLDAVSLFGAGALPRTYFRQLLTAAKEETLDGWLESLPAKGSDIHRGRRLSKRLRREVEPGPGTAEPDGVGRPSESLTFHRTARRSFEVAYWNMIARLAGGRFINKDNADCVDDSATAPLLKHHHRDFDMSWSGGWRSSQEGRSGERDIVCVIPGRDGRRAVIMADHYDTAYREDYYEKDRGGPGTSSRSPQAREPAQPSSPCRHTWRPKPGTHPSQPGTGLHPDAGADRAAEPAEEFLRPVLHEKEADADAQIRECQRHVFPVRELHGGAAADCSSGRCLDNHLPRTQIQLSQNTTGRATRQNMGIRAVGRILSARRNR